MENTRDVKNIRLYHDYCRAAETLAMAEWGNILFGCFRFPHIPKQGAQVITPTIQNTVNIYIGSGNAVKHHISASVYIYPQAYANIRYRTHTFAANTKTKKKTKKKTKTKKKKKTNIYSLYRESVPPIPPKGGNARERKAELLYHGKRVKPGSLCGKSRFV